MPINVSLMHEASCKSWYVYIKSYFKIEIFVNNSKTEQKNEKSVSIPYINIIVL